MVALIPYITAGVPDLSTTTEALKVLDSCGCDIIELGVPYSDPLADGPVIQAATTRSLARGTNFDAIIAMLKEGDEVIRNSENLDQLFLGRSNKLASQIMSLNKNKDCVKKNDAVKIEATLSLCCTFLSCFWERRASYRLFKDC